MDPELNENTEFPLTECGNDRQKVTLYIDSI